MEDMPEGDLLPKNMIHIHYIFDHHMEKGRRGKGRGGKAERRGGGRR